MEFSREQLKIVKELKIVRFTDFRKYLETVYLALKEKSPHFSYRTFARAAGFRSPNFLKLVIDGKKNLSAESIDKLIQVLALNKKEAYSFRNLVLFGQAQSAQEKHHYADQILQSAPYRRSHRLLSDQYQYFSKWYLVPIREMVSLASFNENPESIAKTLLPAISVSEAKGALQLLQDLNLIHRNKDGRLVTTAQTVSTGDQVLDSAVAQFHREMIQKGAEAIERFPSQERDVSSLTLCLSKDQEEKIKRRISEFRKELLQIEAQKNSQSKERVVQINIQLFPLTQATEKQEKS